MSWIDMVGVVSCLLVVAVVGRVRIRPPVMPTRARRSTGRVVFLLGLGASSAISTFVIGHGPQALGLAFAIVALLLAPGYSIVAFRELVDVVDELALALALGTALLVLVGTAMASTGFWEPALVSAASTLVTAPLLSWLGAYHFLLPVVRSHSASTRSDADT